MDRAWWWQVWSLTGPIWKAPCGRSITIRLSCGFISRTTLNMILSNLSETNNQLHAIEFNTPETLFYCAHHMLNHALRALEHRGDIYKSSWWLLYMLTTCTCIADRVVWSFNQDFCGAVPEHLSEGWRCFLDISPTITDNSLSNFSTGMCGLLTMIHIKLLCRNI